uniref:Uncharacterized protein LOC104242263 n=1 Tax=Nicotiana sylvestris TaxID=4096 RepID=A0A1U7XUA1_NICSY|nr:PREDICTED: uncharacterized protein LOC104242263 [Nicotiana sylvestris]
MLVDSFVKAYAGAIKVATRKLDLFKVRQKDNKMLSEFVSRFQKEHMDLPPVTDDWAVQAFTQGSLANIIRSRFVEQLGLLDQIVPVALVLNGFNMASETTKGEIILPVNVARTILETKFHVIKGIPQEITTHRLSLDPKFRPIKQKRMPQSEDIRISCDAESGKSCSSTSVSDLHLANTLQYSLRAYLSILYLKIPENFCIWLRGRIVEYHNIARDLKYPEFIVYKPQNGGCKEGSVITSIGFLKEAPLVNIHGFNVYHRKRLILPFWNVAGSSTARSRGVVGVLEANFIQPTHNKQDFEKTPLFQKLENRLKEMTWEYWDYHCGLIGYHATKRLHKPSQVSSESRQKHATTKRKDHDHSIEPEILKRKAGLRVNLTGPESIQNPPATTTTSHLEDQELVLLLKENKRLYARCSEYEKMDEELNAKVTLLRKELKEAQREYGRLLIESGSLEYPKMESTVTL